MSRKIIIITRDTDSNYSDPNNLLGKLILKGNSIPISKQESCLAAFQYLSKYKTTASDNKTIYEISKIMKDYKIEEIEKINSWLDGKIRKLRIPDGMVNLFDKVRNTLNKEKLYEKIAMENGDTVYLLYWNLLGEKKFNVWHCLPLICKDCEIDMNVTIQEIHDRHILYIHGNEWGRVGSWLLMKNSEPKEKEKGDVLKALKDYFQYIATFQHSNIVGSYFNNILNCRFGEDSIADKLGELEDKENISDFIQLKQEMTKELQNGRNYL